MAEVQEKSRGLKFAEQQLLRHGWEHGKGLGRAENGISEAIKVKVKCDKGGVGHKEGEQFTFHWWDHVFNKASSSLQVESHPNGIHLKKTVEDDEGDGTISNKKPRKAALAKAKLYGCFVKSATLLSGQEQPEPKASNSDTSSSSDEDDDHRLDLSSTIKLTDADLMKACGGRTAHKGARHGLTMSAKLARLEQQEAEFMAKYGKKSQPAQESPACAPPTPPTSQSADQRAERQEEDPQRKKKKNKRSTGSFSDLNGDKVSFENSETDVTPKKKKKKQKANVDACYEEVTNAVPTNGDVICVENCDIFHKTKRKHKKKKEKAEQDDEEEEEESKSPEEAAELHSDTKVKKRKRKKSSKQHREPAKEESTDTKSSQSEPDGDCATKTTKKNSAVALKEAEVAEEEVAVMQKRKKYKKEKPAIDGDDKEALPPKKKKKKSKE